MFLLDSNALIALFRGKSPAVLAELKRRSASDIVLCPVVLAELQYGVWRSSPAHRAANQLLVDQVRSTYSSIPFDDSAALIAARIRAQLATSGQSIGPYDLLIAAIALAHGSILVTHNVSEFERVSGLSVVDWQSD